VAAKRNLITIKRIIADVNIGITLNCAAGSISVLQDDEGGLNQDYERVLLSTAQRSGEGVERDGLVLSSSEITSIGFGPVREDHPSAGSYLLSLGLHEDECEEIIKQYELESQAYLPFRLLPTTAQRQLQLIGLMRTPVTLAVLNDPFMPFSGRWRERFAELLLDYVRTTSSTIVLLNLSFLPKAWSEKPEVRFVNLAAEQEKTVQKHFSVKISEEKRTNLAPAEPLARKLANQGAASGPLASGAPSEVMPGGPAISPPSTGLWWKDALVHGMADFSRSVRTLHGAVAACCVLAAVVGIGIVSYPQASKSWAKMREISSHFEDNKGAPALEEDEGDLSSESEAERASLSTAGQTEGNAALSSEVLSDDSGELAETGSLQDEAAENEELQLASAFLPVGESGHEEPPIDFADLVASGPGDIATALDGNLLCLEQSSRNFSGDGEL
jgi:hypothetical protein